MEKCFKVEAQKVRFQKKLPPEIQTFLSAMPGCREESRTLEQCCGTGQKFYGSGSDLPVPVPKPVPGDPEISKNTDTEGNTNFFHYENLGAIIDHITYL